MGMKLEDKANVNVSIRLPSLGFPNTVSWCDALKATDNGPYNELSSWGQILLSGLFIYGCAGSSLLHRFFSSCGEPGLLLIAVHKLLIAVVSPGEHRL